MYAVYPSRRYIPAKVRAMIEFLQHEINLDPTMTGRVGLV
jgi:DNA-binding transcriptional LysR family regulator